MVADTAYSREPAALRTDNTVLGTPGKRRLGLFRALAALFKDLDDFEERVQTQIHCLTDKIAAKNGRGDVVRNNTEGNLFATGVAAATKLTGNWPPRGDPDR